MHMEELKINRMKELTRRLDPNTFEVRPNRLPESCNMKKRYSKNESLEPWSTQWGLAFYSPMLKSVLG